MKGKYSQRWMLLALLMTLVLVLAACGGGEKPQESAAPAPASQSEAEASTPAEPAQTPEGLPNEFKDMVATYYYPDTMEVAKDSATGSEYLKDKEDKFLFYSYAGMYDYKSAVDQYTKNTEKHTNVTIKDIKVDGKDAKAFASDSSSFGGQLILVIDGGEKYSNTAVVIEIKTPNGGDSKIADIDTPETWKVIENIKLLK